MPSEKFYLSGQIEGDGLPPDFALSWGTEFDTGISRAKLTVWDVPERPDALPQEFEIGTSADHVGLSRFVSALSRARTHLVQNKKPAVIEVPDFLKHDSSKQKKRPDPNPVEQAYVEEHDHKAVQHRDGRQPWCKGCGLTANGEVPAYTTALGKRE